MQGYLRNPLFFRVFVPRQINGGQASYFRDEALAFLSDLAVALWLTAESLPLIAFCWIWTLVPGCLSNARKTRSPNR